MNIFFILFENSHQTYKLWAIYVLALYLMQLVLEFSSEKLEINSSCASEIIV